MTTVERIFRYTKGTKDYESWYKKDGDFELRVYNDVDWARNVDDKKNTSGGAIFLREILVTWITKNQSCISWSTAKAEYVVVVINYSNIVWLKQLFEGIQEEVIEPITIYSNNIY